MRIFLTFASEQNDIAESIQLALRNRGHRVFFSHDDLPPGESFDERIQKSIGECDLLVFLISPQSVAKGRYTLTELAFARGRWRSPRGRVLPVVVAPTPMESIPNYLKAVTLLEPEGNIAAETAAAVDRVRDPTRTRTILAFALLGVVTGLLTYLAFKYPLRSLGFSFAVAQDDFTRPNTPVPGVIFGFLVAAAAYWYGTRDRLLLLVALGFTAVAWILAHDSTYVVYDQLRKFQKPASISRDAETPDREKGTDSGWDEALLTLTKEELQIPYLMGMSGIVGGLVGGFGTVLGVSIANRRFRRFESWVTTIAVAAVLGGALLEAARLAEIFGLLPLFVGWQAAVIALIASRLALGDELTSDP
jgi:TIR domain-containing protein